MRLWLLVFVWACPTSDVPAPERTSEDDGVAAATAEDTPRGVWAQVVRVTDGDTIRVDLEGRRERVRYIGIDTPETQHSPRGAEPFGEEASEANRSLVEGRRVRLVFDVEERDRYGRLLAYVYLRDGTFVNARLVAEGFARALTVPPNVRHADRFRSLEAEARRRRRGLWGLSNTR